MSITSGCIVGFILCVLAAAVEQGPATTTTVQPAPTQLGTVDLFVDSAKTQLAAWQMEFKATAGQLRSSGSSAATTRFSRSALLRSGGIEEQSNMGAFNISDKLPAGKIRVARLHLHISGDQRPVYAVNLVVAGDQEGKPITAQASFSEGVAK